jgi:hypothetical protein
MTGGLPPINSSWRQTSWNSQPVILFSNRTFEVIDSWTHFTVSDSTLPNLEGQVPYLYPPGTGWPGYTPRHWIPPSSPPTTRRATVGVFDPASTLAWNWSKLVPHLQHLGTDHLENKLLYVCVPASCCRNVFTEPLTRNGPGISAHFAVVA